MPHAHLDATVHIAAPAQLVFDRMNNLSRFDDWNPFPSMDPTTTSSHEGPNAGPGAVFNYDGKRLGKGRMEIAGVDAPKRIDINMTFWRGSSASHSHSAFEIIEVNGGCDVHWTFDEDRGFAMFLMGKLMFDRMMTGTFTSGLQTLKSLVEAEAAG
ncbi:MAG: SRPBCC family protein [Agromyces sp.]